MTTSRRRRVRIAALAIGAAGWIGIGTANAAAPSAVVGEWAASIVANGIEIPFRFEIASRGDALVASFFNGERRVSSTASREVDHRWRFSFDQYAATLDVTVDAGALAGEYRRGSRTSYAFKAARAPAGNKPDEARTPDAPSIEGTWIVQAKSSKGETAWRFIARETSGVVSATILRVDGDTGTLSGGFRDGRWVLSHFSGARPLLLEAVPQPDGSLKLRQNGKTELLAVRAGDARAAGIGTPTDPSHHTSVSDAAEPFRFAFPDLDGRTVSNTDATFAGKVVLVNVSGSWCPNCHDEAPFLAALYEKFRDRGLEIVTLSFEEAEQLANPARLRAFIASYGLKHTVLLAGEPDQLHEKVPQAVNLNAFPTTFILGRDGRVRGVHAGFPSPGSGEFYRKAERDISTEVEQLLKERVELTPLIDKTAAAGARLQATLRVRLPTDVHVQSDKPNDPSLIATALTVTSPPGVTVNRIVYPSASNLAQAGRDKPLAVFGPEFAIRSSSPWTRMQRRVRSPYQRSCDIRRATSGCAFHRHVRPRRGSLP